MAVAAYFVSVSGNGKMWPKIWSLSICRPASLVFIQFGL